MFAIVYPRGSRVIIGEQMETFVPRSTSPCRIPLHRSEGWALFSPQNKFCGNDDIKKLPSSRCKPAVRAAMDSPDCVRHIP